MFINSDFLLYGSPFECLSALFLMEIDWDCQLVYVNDVYLEMFIKNYEVRIINSSFTINFEALKII